MSPFYQPLLYLLFSLFLFLHFNFKSKPFLLSFFSILAKLIKSCVENMPTFVQILCGPTDD